MEDLSKENNLMDYDWSEGFNQSNMTGLMHTYYSCLYDELNMDSIKKIPFNFQQVPSKHFDKHSMGSFLTGDAFAHTINLSGVEN